MFAPLLIAAMMGAIPVVWVFALAAVYWAAGMAAAPAWNAWVETLAPQRLHARYFARRTLVSQWGIWAGFVLGGVALQAAAQGSRHLYAFALLFFVAGGVRFVSAGLLSRQREPVPPPKRLVAVPPRAAFASLRGTSTAGCSSTCWRPRRRCRSPGRISPPSCWAGWRSATIATSSSFCAMSVAKIVFLPALGRAVDRLGPRRVLWLSGIAISVIPAMWLVSNSFGYLIVVQAAAGAGWGL